jgi:hypothetical protein
VIVCELNPNSPTHDMASMACTKKTVGLGLLWRLGWGMVELKKRPKTGTVFFFSLFFFAGATSMKSHINDGERNRSHLDMSLLVLHEMHVTFYSRNPPRTPCVRNCPDLLSRALYAE